MAAVRNNHDARLTVGGVPLRPKATTLVPNWTAEVASATERALLDAKLIEVVGDAPKEEKEAEPEKKGKAK